jgi:hypothetical protein
MNPLLLLTALTYAFFWPSTAAAQTTDPIFKILQVPRSSGVNRDDLNKKLASIDNMETVRRVVTTSMGGRIVGPVVIRIHKPGTPVRWWTIAGDNLPETQTDQTLLRSKFVQSETFYRLNDLREFLKDTVFAIDTLALRIHIDNDYQPDGWFLNIICGGKPRILPLTSKGDLVLIPRNLVTGCGTGWIPATLGNRGASQSWLAKFVLYFPDETIKAQLQALAQQFKTDKELEGQASEEDWMSAYIKQNYGTISYQQLDRWLTTVNL